MIANIPKNELSRLAALRRYQILDTVPQEAFDDLTLLASQLCGTPISLVSFIDEGRQWFKSRRGLTISETPRDLAFCAHALLNPGELLIVPDTRKDKRFSDHPAVTCENGIRFYAGAPLVSPGGDALGTLCVVDHRPRKLSDAQKQALRALARQTVAQLELRRHVVEIADHMVERTRMEYALRQSEQQFRAFMDNSPMLAYLKDEHGQYLYVNRPFLQSFGLSTEQVIGQDDFSLWPHMAKERREQDLRVLSGEDDVSVIEMVPGVSGEDRYWQLHKFLLSSVEDSKRFVGSVALDITPNKQYERQLEEYQRQLEEAFAKAEEQSLTDGLTGINNRRWLDYKLDGEFDFAERYNLPLSLLMIDVDEFKSFNDNFGHIAGDELLQQLSSVLKQLLRKTDSIARYGGEEFVVLLPNTSSEGALRLAERFRSAIEDMPTDKRTVTISIGVASSDQGTRDRHALFEAADQALYRAKGNGRNRVEIAEALM